MIFETVSLYQVSSIWWTQAHPHFEYLHEWTAYEARRAPSSSWCHIDETLSYKEHLTHVAAELKSCNNLTWKLASMTAAIILTGTPVCVTESTCVCSCDSRAYYQPFCYFFAPVNTTLANLSLQSGKFASCYKKAQVIWLLKKPGLEILSPAACRPISNQSAVSRVFERLVLTSLRPHLPTSPSYDQLTRRSIPPRLYCWRF